VMSLVSPKSLEEAFACHYSDSIQIAQFAQTQRNHRPVFDLGTGAGFPGLIFAIRYPQQPITLFEKSLKKQTFLTAVVAQLGLGNVQLAGALPERRLSGLFLARAVLPRDDLFRLMRKRMVSGSVLITNLGGRNPVPSIPKYFEKLAEVRYTLPESRGDRCAEALRLLS
jgi:16S rRNA (guanine527-N7)-methyltransferase